MALLYANLRTLSCLALPCAADQPFIFSMLKTLAIYWLATRTIFSIDLFILLSVIKSSSLIWGEGGFTNHLGEARGAE